MKKSEKVLMTATAVVVVAWLGLTFLGGESDSPAAAGGGGSLFGVNSSTVESAKIKYTDTIDRIVEAPETYAQFYELVGNEALTRTADTRERADLEFQREVADWATEAGFTRPNIIKRIEDIRDGNDIVRDYQLVIVTVDIREGDIKRVAELLKSFERRGLIIQEVRMDSTLDTTRVSATITVAKLVEAFYQTRERRARLG